MKTARILSSRPIVLDLLGKVPADLCNLEVFDEDFRSLGRTWGVRVGSKIVSTADTTTIAKIRARRALAV